MNKEEYVINKREIREYISCPEFGDNHYGKWGALRLEQRLCIYNLLFETEDEDKIIKDLLKRIDKAIEYIGNGNIGIPRKTRNKFIKILKGEENE